jgi:hypothetical protein
MATRKSEDRLQLRLYPPFLQFDLGELFSTLEEAMDAGFELRLETERHRFENHL